MLVDRRPTMWWHLLICDAVSCCFLLFLDVSCIFCIFLHLCCQVSPCFLRHFKKVVLDRIVQLHSAVLAEAMTTLQLTSTATAFFVLLLAEDSCFHTISIIFHLQKQFHILQLEAPCSRHACRPFWWPPAALHKSFQILLNDVDFDEFRAVELLRWSPRYIGIFNTLWGLASDFMKENQNCYELDHELLDYYLIYFDFLDLLLGFGELFMKAVGFTACISLHQLAFDCSGCATAFAISFDCAKQLQPWVTKRRNGF